MYVMRLSGSLRPLQFINNLESDPQYSGWTKSLLQVFYMHTLYMYTHVYTGIRVPVFLQFLQPSFPGTLRQVARNAFNLVGVRPCRGLVY